MDEPKDRREDDPYLRYLERGWEPSWSDLKIVVIAALLVGFVWLIKTGHDSFVAHFHH